MLMFSRPIEASHDEETILGDLSSGEVPALDQTPLHPTKLLPSIRPARWRLPSPTLLESRRNGRIERTQLLAPASVEQRPTSRPYLLAVLSAVLLSVLLFSPEAEPTKRALRKASIEVVAEFSKALGAGLSR